MADGEQCREEQYAKLEDLRISLDRGGAGEEEGGDGEGEGEHGGGFGFSLCVWIYLSGSARPSSIILKQVSGSSCRSSWSWKRKSLYCLFLLFACFFPFSPRLLIRIPWVLVRVLLVCFALLLVLESSCESFSCWLTCKGRFFLVWDKRGEPEIPFPYSLWFMFEVDADKWNEFVRLFI